MTVAQRFLFDTSFDAGAAPRSARRAAAKAEPVPTAEETAAQTEAAIAQARAEGYETGRTEGETAGRQSGFEAGQAAGREEAQEAAGQQTATALTAIEQNLQALLTQHAETTAEAKSLALTALRATLAKLYPVLAERHGLAEMEALLTACLTRLNDEPRVVVRIADGLYDALDERLSQITRQSGFEGKFVLLSEPDLPSGDLRVEWADGGAERDTAAAAAEIDEILDRALGDGSAPAHTSDEGPEPSDGTQEG